MKTILSIIPYAFTQKDFFEMREPVKNYPSRHFFNSIAEWCVRDDNGFADYTENYHQFTGTLDDNSPKQYFLFDITPIDLMLQEEISNCGFEGLFEGYNWGPLFEEISFNEPPLKSLRIPHNVHIVVDLYYEGGDGDYDLIVEVLGFLDGNMELSRI